MSHTERMAVAIAETIRTSTLTNEVLRSVIGSTGQRDQSRLLLDALDMLRSSLDEEESK